MKIVVLDGYTTNPGDLPFSGFEALGEVEFYDFTAPEDTLARCEGADIIINNKTVLSRDILEKLTAKYVGLISTGYNVVDVEAAAELGITVTNVPTYSTEAVAQHTFALILELYNHVGSHNAAVHEGKWNDPRKFCFWNEPLRELSGKTLGIIGYGRIGRQTAKIADAFGMNVIFSARRKIEDTHHEQVELDELFKRADIVSLHCPLTPETTGIINADNIAKMKSSAVIINTSRGGAVVEKDLADALNEDRIAGAAVDVLSVEPPMADNPLLTAKNCKITPHIAWAAHETRSRLLDIAVDNLKKYLAGNPVNVVLK